LQESCRKSRAENKYRSLHDHNDGGDSLDGGASSGSLRMVDTGRSPGGVQTIGRQASNRPRVFMLLKGLVVP
jgi:hypothetical protein